MKKMVLVLAAACALLSTGFLAAAPWAHPPASGHAAAIVAHDEQPVGERQ